MEEEKDGRVIRKSLVFFEEEFDAFIATFAALFSSAANVQEKEITVLDLFRKHQAEKEPSGIKSWDKDKRPREKFLEYGPGVLSNAELLAMLIGSGSPQDSAVDLSQKVLDAAANEIKNLKFFKHLDLVRFKGIGIAKSSAILSAIELGKRIYAAENNNVFIKGKKPVAKLIK